MRILIVEDHPMFRDGLAAMLGDRDDVDVVEAVTSGREALEICATFTPNVAVVDLGIPEGDGFWLIRELRRSSPTTRVLVLTSAEDDRSVTDALSAGAHGYLLKSAAPAAIAEAVSSIDRGAAVVSDDILARMNRRLTTQPGTRSGRPFPQLTEREHEVLEGLARGRGTDSIAKELGVAPKTVRNHVSNVLMKLGVADRSAAVVAAHDRGLG